MMCQALLSATLAVTHLWPLAMVTRSADHDGPLMSATLEP